MGEGYRVLRDDPVKTWGEGCSQWTVTDLCETNSVVPTTFVGRYVSGPWGGVGWGGSYHGSDFLDEIRGF